MTTYFRCGQCGTIRQAQEMVIYSEDEFSEYGPPEELAKPAISRHGHRCGFLAIRCKEHKNAERLARQAMLRHLKSGGRVKLS